MYINFIFGILTLLSIGMRNRMSMFFFFLLSLEMPAGLLVCATKNIPEGGLQGMSIDCLAHQG